MIYTGFIDTQTSISLSHIIIYVLGGFSLSRRNAVAFYVNQYYAGVSSSAVAVLAAYRRQLYSNVSSGRLVYAKGTKCVRFCYRKIMFYSINYIASKMFTAKMQLCILEDHHFILYILTVSVECFSPNIMLTLRAVNDTVDVREHIKVKLY